MEFFSFPLLEQLSIDWIHLSSDSCLPLLILLGNIEEDGRQQDTRIAG